MQQFKLLMNISPIALQIADSIDIYIPEASDLFKDVYTDTPSNVTTYPHAVDGVIPTENEHGFIEISDNEPKIYWFNTIE